jgi:DNA-binding response OmpR family regulator
VDVELVRWPSEEKARDHFCDLGRPRLLLVEEGVAPPISADVLEDWIRMPIDDIDLQARVDGLQLRVEAHRDDVPDLDVDGVLRLGRGWVSLPPVEARLIGALLARIGAVVSRDALAQAGWPGGAPGRNALDVHVLRLRRRIDELGLKIRTVRSRGYLLEIVRPGATTG